jgi:hypothetical protein
MPSPSLNPDVADVAPTDPDLTVYDKEHVVTYLRILDAATENADSEMDVELRLSVAFARRRLTRLSPRLITAGCGSTRAAPM